jgi:hypothetical protein
MPSEEIQEFAKLLAEATGKPVEEVMYVIEQMIDTEVEKAVEEELKNGNKEKLIKLIEKLVEDKVKHKVDQEIKMHMNDYLRWMDDGGPAY